MNREKLYQAALSFVGKDAHTDNLAPAAYACADSVNTVFRSVFGVNIGGGPSTTAMYQLLLNDTRFKETILPQHGDIIISPTGYVSTAHGHVGIYGDGGLIYSNNSYTGIWDTHLNTSLWAEMFDFTRYFTLIDPTTGNGGDSGGSQPTVDQITTKLTLLQQLLSLYQKLKDLTGNK